MLCLSKHSIRVGDQGFRRQSLRLAQKQRTVFLLSPQLIRSLRVCVGLSTKTQNGITIVTWPLNPQTRFPWGPRKEAQVPRTVNLRRRNPGNHFLTIPRAGGGCGPPVSPRFCLRRPPPRIHAPLPHARAPAGWPAGFLSVLLHKPYFHQHPSFT